MRFYREKKSSLELHIYMTMEMTMWHIDVIEIHTNHMKTFPTSNILNLLGFFIHDTNG